MGIVVGIENEMGIGGGIHFGSGEVEEIDFEGTGCGCGIVCYCQNPILHESEEKYYFRKFPESAGVIQKING